MGEIVQKMEKNVGIYASEKATWAKICAKAVENLLWKKKLRCQSKKTITVGNMSVNKPVKCPLCSDGLLTLTKTTSAN